MNDSQNDDNNTANGIIPLMKSGSSSTLTQRYNNSGGETLSSAIDGAWGVFTSQLSGSSSSNEWLLKNSTPENKSNVLSPNYTVNQIYVGGRRSVSSGVNYANMDLAELIVYNRQFTCTEMQQIENYLEVKYDRSYGEKTCT
jgi:hypothetical protein